ncbi:MAG: DUF411 domain-containing protein [Gemmatimonadetes bacterium]|nr:DUF411 domain-containing protein [Gemmatimonadota bacterium]
MNRNITKVERREGRVATAVARTRFTRRAWIGAITGGLALVIIGERKRRTRPLLALGEVTVFKSPSCQCCGKWVERMREHGFALGEENMADVSPVKQKYGVPANLYSCHTGIAGGYSFEGHVPPDLVARVLQERPGFAGLAVPGMPQSAPGMDLGHQPYDVLSFTQSGETAVYATR